MTFLPPFRADHVGSLLRPKKLSAARKEWREGLITAEQLRSIEDNHILEAVKKQEEIGLKGITDGEYRRDYWHLDFMWSFDGVIPSDDIYTNRFHGVEFSARAAEISDRVSYPKNGIMLDHFKFLTKSVKETAKFTIPSAAQFRHREGVRLANTDAYTDLDEFWDDIGRSYKRAVLAFAELGCKYIQIDDVNSALLCDPKIRAGFEKYGGDPSQMLDVNIDVNNAALANRPDDMRATIHLCRGNFQSTYAGRGGYEVMAEKYLVKIDVNGFFMEFDDDRSGDFAPLRFLPKDKYVVIGIMTSKRPMLETKEVLKRRIDAAAKYIPLEQICISPQCGFASTKEGNKLSEENQWRKLERLVEVADEVWG